MILNGQEEMTAAAIARHAGVGRAAVSNWRRRYPEFPHPVGGSPTSPTFSRKQVEAWLAATGKADQLATAGRTETGTQRISDAPELPERAIADLTAGQLLARVMVSLLPPSTADPRSVDADPRSVDASDADLPVVLDPACFQATLLMAAADRFGDRVRLVGQEILESAAAIAALHLRGNAYGAPYEIHTGDSLRDNRLGAYRGAAAAVVCEPPFDRPGWPSLELTTDPRWEFGVPAPRDSELAWVQHCYAHLRPHGVAVVAVSRRTCVQPSGHHIRAALVRAGVLRAVISLPKGMSSVPDTDVCLWVLERQLPGHQALGHQALGRQDLGRQDLGRQHGAPDHHAVRMVELSAVGDPADVPQEFAGWRRLFDDADPTISRAVPRLELLDGDTNLLPSRHVAAGVEASAGDFARVTDRLVALYARVGQGLPRFAAPPSPVRWAYVTLGELERVGALRIRSRDTTPLAGDVLLRTLGRPPIVATGTDADDVGVAQVVEVDASRLDANFVATFLRTDAGAVPVANTLGALNRDDLRRCRIPRMPPAEQRRYGDVFRQLHELQGALSALAKVSANVIDQTIHGLTTGAVSPSGRATEISNDVDATEGETSKL